MLAAMSPFVASAYLPRFAGEAHVHGGETMAVPEGWAETEGALQREFHFKDFSAAINFVNRPAEVAQTAGHHPDISIHWNRVVVRWSTHAAQAITDRDAEPAARTDELASR